MTYESADLECKILGSQLLTIKTDLQNKLITELVYHNWKKDTDFWLGARMLHKQGYLNFKFTSTLIQIQTTVVNGFGMTSQK